MVVGLPLWQRQNAPVLRGDKPLASLLAEGQELPRNRCLLRWSGPPGAIYHTLTGQSLGRARA